MAQNLLASLALAGIIERTGPGRKVLRVTPRFMAHAEGTAGRFQALGLRSEPADILRTALTTWDEYRHDPTRGARFLLDVLQDHDQMGALAPVFPTIEAFSAAA